ncbi:retrotransposon protein, putative, ty1-copia subclass [Tanacetum coccineum]
MVYFMMSHTTLPKSFWDYALESAARILNMVPTKKVEKTPYKVWYEQAPKLSYLKVWGCEALVKHDTLIKPGKLEPRSIKCIFAGYLKETMSYSFYYPPENKVIVARNVEFFKNSLISQEVSRSLEDLEVIQEEASGSTKRILTWMARYTPKAHLVAKGFTQAYGIDYEETFSPVSYIRAIRILIVIAAYYDYKIWQMDVKTAFLNGHLTEEVYMVQLAGFINQKYSNQVCKSQRLIYRHKQASRQWNKRFDEEIKKFGFTQNRDEPYVYVKASGSNVTSLILYVDDILIMVSHVPMLQGVKSYLGKWFSMKDLGEVPCILGIKIYKDRSRRLIGLCQSAYIEKILKRYNMDNSKRGNVPMQEKPRLSKDQGASTPDENPGELHWTIVKNISMYLWNSKYIFLVHGGDIKWELRVTCYTDAGYLTDVYDSKSHSGYVFVFKG